MNNGKITVLVDIDDCLIDLLPAWLSYLNNKYNLNVTEDQVVDWNMKLVYPTLSNDQLYGVLNEHELWLTVKPIDGAINTLQQMFNDERLDVKLCTASHYKTLITKFDTALFPYFNFLSYKDIIICHDKSLINTDFRIDDYHENLKGNGIKILINKPYNEGISRDTYNIRVNNITEAYNEIKNYLKFKEVIEND